ncbi:DUF559 domain-containing protein [Nocardioides sp. Kera G14]|uniref:DUF559 domain-containing protein n=1 Tax=Nocardioides sp. Kera G14 TaxID=2884264 RepID=UPI001D119D85|nr:DUF559 domain-containing protein [Nocardioides sp. Kera G14]UDY23189.1 DUF559 domain-containing protein [Nocardioides sp. Kera G14]
MTLEAITTLDTRVPFTRADALKAGITASQLRSSAYVAMHQGIYVASDVEVTPRIRALAALQGFPAGAFASHATAGRLWELPLPTLPDEHVTVADRKHRRRRPGIVCHSPRRAVIGTKGEVPCTSSAQTFVDLADQLSLVDLVVVGDHLVRKGICKVRQLVEAAARATGSSAEHARLAASLVRPKVDSPMESRLRLLLVLAGLPEPDVNPLVSTDGGLTMRKYDLCWLKARFIVEYDGRHHIERVEQWESDLTRREAIDDDGWRIIVVTADGIYKNPGETVAKVHRLLRERRVPGTPVMTDPGWQRHFPGRS